MTEMNITERSKELFPTLKGVWEKGAFAQANEFMDSGQSAREGSSLVANMLIEVAWIVAGCGAVTEGDRPNKDRFRAAVEDALDRITFGELHPNTADTSPDDGSEA